MENSGGIQGNITAGLAGRYAVALFDLARESNAIDAVGKSLATLKTGLADSADLSALIASPVVSRTDAANAIAAVAKALKLDSLTAKFLGVLADNGRLSELKSVIKAVRTLAAGHRNETTAEVTSAFPLDDKQLAALKSNLKARLGRDVAIDAKVDPSLLGGLIVRHGSQMIDASIKTKLNNLALAMKG